MKILAFDTSSIACSVALQNGNQIKAMHEIAALQQGRLILPMINSLLDTCSLKLSQLDAIVYGCGPGSFTGARIASTIAQGIGFVTKLPIVPISSLAAIAQAAFLEHGWHKLLVAIDARVDQLYWAAYSVKGNCVELVGQESTSTPEETKLPFAEDSSDWFGVGDGWERYASKLLRHRPKIIHSSQLPTAQALLKLAKIKLAEGDWIEAQEATPVYAPHSHNLHFLARC